jgi:hypothetical protein
MLALIFNRAPKRRIVGLLALGEWGPATNAISGSITTDQPGQQSIASGAVVEPVVHVVSGGGGSGFGIGPYPWKKIPAITGVCRTEQARQDSQLTGDVIDTELEMVTAILLMAAD